LGTAAIVDTINNIVLKDFILTNNFNYKLYLWIQNEQLQSINLKSELTIQVDINYKQFPTIINNNQT